jgi:xylose dehydrogenase (NAD/NADP)
MNRNVKWGILGCAGIAKRALIPAIRESRNGVLYAIASRDEKTARGWAGDFGFEKAYGSYEALVDDPEVEAVYIPLPNHLHAEWSIRAAGADKHVLCEKPMAMNAGEVREMAAAAEKTGTRLEEAFMYKFHPQMDQTLAIIGSGRLGRLRSVHSSFSFAHEFDSRDYRWQPEMGGGALYDVGCYTISVSRLVFGEEPVQVFARSRRHQTHRIDVSTHLVLEFSGGRFALCDCGFDSQFQSRLIAVGDRGALRLERAFSAKEFDVDIHLEEGAGHRDVRIPRAHMYTVMVEDFAAAILGDHAARYPASDAVGNMAVIDACFESIRTGRPVDLPGRPEG